MDNPAPKKLLHSRLRSLLYPAALIAYALSILILFLWAAKFFGSNINKALNNDGAGAEAQMMKLDLETYSLVAKKLGIASTTIPLPTSSAPAATSTAAVTAADSNGVPSPTPPPPPTSTENTKATLKIAVLNSTGVSGLAGRLRDALAQAGFTVSRTGNSTPRLELTQVSAKEAVINGNAALIDEILEVISNQGYSPGPVQTLGADSAEDVAVTIGGQ